MKTESINKQIPNPITVSIMIAAPNGIARDVGRKLSPFMALYFQILSVLLTYKLVSAFDVIAAGENANGDG